MQTSTITRHPLSKHVPINTIILLYLFILLHKLCMEIPKFLQHRLQQFGLRQDGRAEMECARFLSETTARNNTNAGVFQQLERVKNVRCLIRLFGGFYRLRRYCYLGERVHGTLHWITTEPFEAIEGVRHHFRP